MKKLIGFAIALSGALCLLIGQDAQHHGRSKEGGIPAIAIPDFRGAGDAQKFMAAFNETLSADVKSSGPVQDRPQDVAAHLRPAAALRFPAARAAARSAAQSADASRRQHPSCPPTAGDAGCRIGPARPPRPTTWPSATPPSQNGVLVLQGWLFDLSKDTPRNAQLIGKRYLGTVDEAGARKVAHEFAADIIALFGGQSLFGTHIYFTSDRTGHKEIWMMDPDGKNQRQITHFNNISTYPTVSPDGSKVAFTSWVKGQPAIFVFSVDPVRDLRFYNQAASVNQAGSFTPDGKQIVYASSAGTGGVAGSSSRIWMERGFGRSLRQAPSKSSQKSIRRPGPISYSLRVAPVRNRFIG